MPVNATRTHAIDVQFGSIDNIEVFMCSNYDNLSIYLIGEKLDGVFCERLKNERLKI